MHSISSRIWTCVDVPISCDDNYYTTGDKEFIYNLQIQIGSEIVF